jgi:hypothetical protein
MQSLKRAAAPHAVSADAEVFSVSHLLNTLRRYVPVIAITLVATATLYAILAISLFLLAPTQAVTVLPFRLQFSGVENGQYPNGTKFSTADIVNAPILEHVYKSNDLRRFLSFDDFKDRLSILESNHGIDALNREYQAKLADPKLTSVDRDRLQREYELKVASVVRNEYTINFLEHERLSTLPKTLVEKALNDVLLTFAEQAMKEHGGLDYRAPMITRNAFSAVRPDQNPNLSIAADVLRAKIRAAIRTIDRLLTIPGAEVLRTDRDQLSLVELRGRLEDLLRFDIQPLANDLRNQPWAGDPALTRSFLLAQIDFNATQAEEMRHRQTTFQEALATYRDKAPARVGTETAAAAPSPQAFLTENFVDKVVALSTQSADMLYRQKLVGAISDNGVGAVPYDSEVDYYKVLLAQSAPPSSSMNATQARQRLMNAYNQAVETVDKAMEIYRLLSKNLNPGNVMLSPTSAAFQQRERTISVARLALYGVLIMILAIPLTIAGCLIHNRVREEEEEEESEGSFETRANEQPA